MDQNLLCSSVFKPVYVISAPHDQFTLYTILVIFTGI